MAALLISLHMEPFIFVNDTRTELCFLRTPLERKSEGEGDSLWHSTLSGVAHSVSCARSVGSASNSKARSRHVAVNVPVQPWRVLLCICRVAAYCFFEKASVEVKGVGRNCHGLGSNYVHSCSFAVWPFKNLALGVDGNPILLPSILVLYEVAR